MIDIPPSYIMRTARDTLARSESKTFYQYIAILSEYYQVKPPHALIVNKEKCEKEGPDVIACYEPSTKTIISREPTISEKSMLHEFYHYLSDVKGRVVFRKSKEERDAEQSLAYAFAEACMEVQ